MDQKNRSSCPKAVCEKIFKAITFGPAAFTTIRRISTRQQQTPSKYAPNPSLPNSDPPPIKTKTTSKESGSEIPIRFDYTATRPKPKPTALNGTFTQNNSQVPLDRMAQQAKTTKPCSDMVQQAQIKSNPKAEKSNVEIIQVQTERHQAKPTKSYDDRFSAYIIQTRKRIMSHDHEDYSRKNN